MKKYALVIVALILLPSFLVAQNRPPQNIRRITVTNKYEIIDGKRTSKFKAIKQEFYDSLGQMNSVVYLNYTTGQVESNIWNTYENGVRVLSEEFENGIFKRLIRYSYISKTLIDKEIIYEVVDKDTLLHLTKIFTYNNESRPIRIEEFDKSNKKVSTVKITYGKNGIELKKIVTAKKGFIPRDSIRSIINSPRYDSLGRLESEQISKVYFDNKKDKEINRYLYDNNGKVIQKTIFDINGNIKTVFRYKYNNSGRVIEQSQLNSQEHYIESLAFRYELYRTPDLRYREIEY